MIQPARLDEAQADAAQRPVIGVQVVAAHRRGGPCEAAGEHHIAGVQALASIPSRDELLATLLGVMQAPVSGFACAMAALARKREEPAAAEEEVAA